MQKAMSNEGTSSRTRLDYALVFIFFGVYLWLRWWSDWWQNRWVGFALGAAYALIFLVRDWGRVGSDIHSKGLHLGCSILFFLVGAVSFASFSVAGTAVMDSPAS
jgi:hypothetical protein